jgi:hypothetical protein
MPLVIEAKILSRCMILYGSWSAFAISNANRIASDKWTHLLYLYWNCTISNNSGIPLIFRIKVCHLGLLIRSTLRMAVSAMCILKVRFQILSSSMKMVVFWDVAPCGLVELDWCFRGGYCLCHQGDALLKYWSTSTRLHGATSQKAAIFVYIEVCNKYFRPCHEADLFGASIWSAWPANKFITAFISGGSYFTKPWLQCHGVYGRIRSPQIADYYSYFC